MAVGLTGAIRPRLSHFRTTCSVVKHIHLGTLHSPNVSGSSSGQSAASRPPEQPLTTRLAGARPPHPGGPLRARAGLGVWENTGLRRRARARTPGLEVHLHICRRVCVVLRHIVCVAGSESSFPRSQGFCRAMVAARVWRTLERSTWRLVYQRPAAIAVQTNRPSQPLR